MTGIAFERRKRLQTHQWTFVFHHNNIKSHTRHFNLQFRNGITSLPADDVYCWWEVYLNKSLYSFIVSHWAYTIELFSKLNEHMESILKDQSPCLWFRKYFTIILIQISRCFTSGLLYHRYEFTEPGLSQTLTSISKFTVPTIEYLPCRSINTSEVTN